MIKSKYFSLIVGVTMGMAAILALALLIIPTTTTVMMPREDIPLFQRDSVADVQITINSNDWQELLDNAIKEQYYPCTVVINGETFSNVGIRAKGNSSLRSVATDETTDRYSFKLKFDQYIDGQQYYGRSTLNLNNGFSDTTYMKEYLAYDVFEEMDLSTPQRGYANIQINDAPWGLYLAVENIDEDFIYNYYGSVDGNLYKPEDNAGNLAWIDHNPDSYSGLRNSAVTKVSDTEFQRMIDMLEHLHTGEDLEQYLDVDSVLRYIAVNVFLVNLDSYQGGFYHNYYWYETDGVFSIIPWDLNMAFGGFAGGGGNKGGRPEQSANQGKLDRGQLNSREDLTNNLVNTTDREAMEQGGRPMGAGFQDKDASAIYLPIDEPVSGNLEDYPLVAKLLAVEEYKERYDQYLRQLVQVYGNQEVFATKVDQVAQLIEDYVAGDATAFYTLEQFQQSIPMLKVFMELRSTSVQMQLDGIIPATSAGQDEIELNQYLDLSGLNMNTLGDMALGGKPGNADGQPMGGQLPPGIPDGAMNGPQQKGSEADMAAMKPMDQNRPPMGMNRGQGAIEQKNQLFRTNLTQQELIYIAVSAVMLVISFLGVVRFKRRKYGSK